MPQCAALYTLHPAPCASAMRPEPVPVRASPSLSHAHWPSHPDGLPVSPLQAATEGRVLILEGIEKAERNVLPVLNNLLENREMQVGAPPTVMHHVFHVSLLNY